MAIERDRIERFDMKPMGAVVTVDSLLAEAKRIRDYAAADLPRRPDARLMALEDRTARVRAWLNDLVLDLEGVSD